MRSEGSTKGSEYIHEVNEVNVPSTVTGEACAARVVKHVVNAIASMCVGFVVYWFMVVSCLCFGFRSELHDPLSSPFAASAAIHHGISRKLLTLG